MRLYQDQRGQAIIETTILALVGALVGLVIMSVFSGDLFSRLVDAASHSMLTEVPGGSAAQALSDIADFMTF